VIASGSISKSKEFKSQMNAAYNACISRSDSCISAVEVLFSANSGVFSDTSALNPKP